MGDHRIHAEDQVQPRDLAGCRQRFVVGWSFDPRDSQPRTVPPELIVLGPMLQRYPRQWPARPCSSTANFANGIEREVS